MAKSQKSVLLAIAGLVLTGCQNMNNTQSGALLGTGLGATAGALVGSASGHAGGGALIGAAAGAVTGGLVGNAEDAREQRDAAVANAQYEHARSAAIAQAVTETDVITMTRSGVGDEVIINALRTRGCRWNSSPDNVIALKHEGVSDRVIQAMQNTGLQPP
ncbi:MAG TPA: glycine zipper domain-containing protein, partial [Planctomycetaceae bacterium]|nr:glycine zipper domain-containing protein [Planctomycetaceae bacterium]